MKAILLCKSALAALALFAMMFASAAEARVGVFIGLGAPVVAAPYPAYYPAYAYPAPQPYPYAPAPGYAYAPGFPPPPPPYAPQPYYAPYGAIR